MVTSEDNIYKLTSKELIIFLIYIFVAVLYFMPVLSARDIFIERDLSVYFIPPRYLWAQLVSQGEFPFWNPFNYSGTPLFAKLQPGILYLPQLFYLFFPFNLVWNWLVILHFAFAGIAMYALMRHFGISIIGSFTGGIIFMLSGYLMSVHNLLTHLFSAPWTPLILLFFFKYFEKQKIINLIYSSLCLTLQFLAGAPEIVIITLFLLFVSGIFLKTITGENVPLVERVNKVTIIIFLFFLMSSVQLIPFIELQYHSIRKSGISYQEATTWSFALRDVVQFFIPDFFGYHSSSAKYWSNQSWLKTVYLGIMPFFISILYFLTNDKKRWIFLLLMFISFVFALGGNTPIYALLHKLPFFSSIRYPVKFLYLFFFIIAMTSALGLDFLRKGVEEKTKRVLLPIHILFYGGFVFAVLWGFIAICYDETFMLLDKYGVKPDGFNDIAKNIHNMRRFLFFSFLLSIAPLIYLRIKSRWFLLVIVGLISADLFFANYMFYKAAPWNDFKRNNDFINEISAQKDTGRYFISPKTMTEFPDQYPINKEIIIPAYAPLFNLYSIDGVEVFRIAQHDKMLEILKTTSDIDSAKRYFHILAVNALVTSYELNDKDFKFLKQVLVEKKTAYLYEYKAFPGRFLLFNRAVYVDDTKAAIEKLTDKTIDLRSTLVLIGTDEKQMNNEESQGASIGTTTLVSYDANKVVIECEAKTDTFLYVSDTYYPGWKAYVDGKATKIYQANLAFRAVKIPAGNHRVVFRYIPLSFYIGLMLTIFGVVMCIWLIKRDRKDKNENV